MSFIDNYSIFLCILYTHNCINLLNACTQRQRICMKTALYPYIHAKNGTHINVQPEVVLGADISDGREGVEGTEHRGAGRRVDKERSLAGSQRLLHTALQRLRDHAARPVTRHLVYVVGPQAQPVRRLQYRVVALLQGHHSFQGNPPSATYVLILFLATSYYCSSATSCTMLMFIV